MPHYIDATATQKSCDPQTKPQTLPKPNPKPSKPPPPLPLVQNPRHQIPNHKSRPKPDLKQQKPPVGV